MNVLIACEYSGRVRESFADLGHNAYSCDLIDTEIPSKKHIIGDVLQVIDRGWDLMIAHPPCQYLSRAGARWKSPERDSLADSAMDFFMRLYNVPIPRVAVENPIGLPWSRFRKPDQTIHPWQFGEPVTKETCLWLRGLPPLMYTLIDPDPFVNWTDRATHGSDKSKSRSRTFWGIARAMAWQWGGDITTIT